MADRTVNGIRGCINSLDMTVGPCVEQASNSLAREQVALMMKYLTFVSKRVNLIGDRVRFELGWYVEMGTGVAEAMQRFGQDTSELVDLCDRGKGSLALAGARQVELEAVSSVLRTEVSRILRTLAGGCQALRKAVHAVVVACSRPLIEFQRSWFAPQAWESNADQLPDVETLLAKPAPSAHAPI
ncbi:MAG: hypothetical protein P4L96_11330 [Rhodoferax sp.]|nr:hypothetical protein [Rhodoferax sp.]